VSNIYATFVTPIPATIVANKISCMVFSLIRMCKVTMINGHYLVDVSPTGFGTDGRIEDANY